MAKKETKRSSTPVSKEELYSNDAQNKSTDAQQAKLMSQIVNKDPQALQKVGGMSIPPSLTENLLAGKVQIPKGQPLYTPQQMEAKRQATNEAAIANDPNAQPGKSWWESTKDFVSGNKDIVGAGLQAGAAIGGYTAGRGAREEQKDIMADQLATAGEIGASSRALQYPTDMYAQQRSALEQIAATPGGMTPEFQRMSEQALQKGQQLTGAGIKQAQDLAARTSQGGASQAGQLFTAAALGAQQAGNVASNLQKDIGVEAYKNRMSALEKMSGLQSQQFREQLALAGQQDTTAASRALYSGAARTQQAGIAQAGGEAQANLYTAGANLGERVLGTAPKPQQPQSPTTNIALTLGGIAADALKGQDQVKATAGTQTTPPTQGTNPPAKEQPPVTGSVTPQNQARGAALQKTAVTGVSPQKPAQRAVATTPPAQGQQLQKMNTQNLAAPQGPGIVQQGVDKAKELYAKVPQAQKDQIMKQGQQMLTGLFKKS